MDEAETLKQKIETLELQMKEERIKYKKDIERIKSVSSELDHTNILVADANTGWKSH